MRSGCARSLSSIDRKVFEERRTVLGVVLPARRLAEVLKACRAFVLRSKRQKNVLSTDHKDEKAVLFGPDVATTFEELTLKLKDANKHDAIELLEASKIRCMNHSYIRGYDELTGPEALRMLIPADIKEIPKSFEICGHIAHINLTEDLLPYKNLIGQVILDKHPNLRTVVNKTGNITAQFRTFPLEVIAGADDLEVELMESGNRFRFNFAKVYWNSRLGQEHQRLVARFSAGQVVVDAFCGVGPFVIPAAKADCTVYANDLNPESYKSLVENVQLNKVGEKVVECANEDGREFIRRIVARERVVADHFVMNLPDSALSFLDSFQGVFPADLYESQPAAVAEDAEPQSKRLKRHPLPYIHCYCFKKQEEDHSSLIEKAQTYLGGKLNAKDVQIRLVRNVAPYKDMYCLHFRVPAHVAFPKPV